MEPLNLAICDDLPEEREALLALLEQAPIAFTTTSTEHTLESYRLSVLKYLEKPVKQKDINDLLPRLEGQPFFCPPQELLCQPGLCPGDQRGISVL